MKIYGLHVVIGSFAMFGCDRVFYYPNCKRYGSPEELNLSYEAVQFPTRGGSMLHGYFFPAQLSSASRPMSGIAGHGEPALQLRDHPPRRASSGRPLRARGTVLHLHGNAGNITGHFVHVAWLPAEGWNVLTFDYCGYGESQGRMTREGSIADAHAALDYLLQRRDVDPESVVALGQSLGGAIGIVLAAQRSEIRGLATDGAFDSYRNVVAWHVRRNPFLFLTAWWFPYVMRAGYDPIDYVGKISPRPIFIMHGTADQVVDPAMARRLYDAAKEPKKLWLVEGAGHYGALQDDPEEARPRLLSFFERCVQRTLSETETFAR